MVQRPKELKDLPGDENLLTNEGRIAHSEMILGRFTFLGNYEPVKVHRVGTIDVGFFYPTINQYCQRIEASTMHRILKIAYESELFRLDEISLVMAIYFMGDTADKKKTELRKHFSSLVKTDAALFSFCKYAAILHKEKRQAIFCKTIKKAITSWYKSQSPENIAHMFSTNRSRNGFTHRSLIRLCRIPDTILGTKYIYQTFANSCTTLLKRSNLPLPPSPVAKPKTKKKSTRPWRGSIGLQLAASPVGVQFPTRSVESGHPMPSTSRQAAQPQTQAPPPCDPTKVRSIVLVISELRLTLDPERAVQLILEYKLQWENLPLHLYQYPNVLKAVAPTMSCEDLLQCIHSTKLRKHFAKQEVLKFFREKFQKKGGLKNENVDPIMFVKNLDRLSIPNPLRSTNNKRTPRGRIIHFSKQLFKNSFFETKPLDLRVHITINMQNSYMKKQLKNLHNIGYQLAAVALAFTYLKSEKHCDIYRWTEEPNQLETVPFDKNGDFIAAYQLCQYITNSKNNQRLYAPLLHAESISHQKIYDLFIVIVPSAARGNKRHCSEMLTNYIDNYRNKNNSRARYVIVDLLRHKKSMRYAHVSCENLLEICGIDEHSVKLIRNFALGRFD